MKTNEQEKSSLNKEEMNGSYGCKMYSGANGVDLQRALDERRYHTTRTSCSSWTSGCSKESTIKIKSTEIQNENTAGKSLYTVLNNMIGKPRPSVRERRRNTLPTLPVWEPQRRSRKTLSLSELDYETEVINGTLTTTLCSTEL